MHLATLPLEFMQQLAALVRNAGSSQHLSCLRYERASVCCADVHPEP